MNNPDPYERRTDRGLHEALMRSSQPESAEPSAEHSALAVRRDPSHPTPDTAQAEQSQGRRSIAWVRPSDLPTVTGAPWARRGIDLQADLTRRARRTPAATARAGRRITRTAIARPETTQATTTTSTSREGLEL